MAKSRGMIIPPGFSASKLFQRISSSVRPVPSMIRAVQLLNKAGEVHLLVCFLLVHSEWVIM